MRLLDTRFSGIARGVGTAKILGRVHSAQMKLADLFLPCSFTIMEVYIQLSSIIISLLISLQGRDVDLLLGLDMLKAHQACIDLEKNVLRIQGREVPFLSEHELPDKARDPLEPSVEASTSSGPSSSTPRTSSTPAPAAFPGGGRTIGSTPAGGGAGAPTTNPPPRPQRTTPSEQSIRLLMDLGATRELAISTLEAAGGNVDVAASLLF
jgi:DNA damage-inducible protein 1